MKKSMILSFSALIVVALVALGIASFAVAQNASEAQLERCMKEQLGLFESDLDNGAELVDLVKRYDLALKQTRLTVIALDGDVIYDTKIAEDGMINHADRPEFQQAAEQGIGSSKRFSSSVWQDYKYVAKKMAYQGQAVVVRLATQTNALDAVAQQASVYLLFALLIVIGIAVLLSVVVSKRLTAPLSALTRRAEAISQGDYHQDFDIPAKHEMAELVSTFALMSRRLSDAIGQLRGKNLQMQTIINSMNGGLVAIDEGEMIIFVNAAAAHMIGVDSTQTQGKPLDVVFRDQTLLDFVHSNSDEPVQLEYMDKVYTVYQRGMKDGAKTCGKVIFIYDVTQLEELENHRSEFASNVSHELKTPLTSIKGFVDTLKMGAINKPEAAEKFLDIIDIEVDRLTSLIDDILELSHIENTGADDNITPNEIDDIAGEVIELVGTQAKAKHVMLRYHNNSDIRTVKVNRDRFKQLLINLVNNAIMYNKEGGSVDVAVRREQQSVVLSVKDTGIGIEPEHIGRLFERFYRVDKGRSRASGGTGLGLSIVKHIVNLYGGTVEVQSVPGEGSEFIVRIPGERLV